MLKEIEGANGNRYRIWKFFSQADFHWKYGVVQLPAEVTILKGHSVSKIGAVENARRRLKKYLNEGETR